MGLLKNSILTALFIFPIVSFADMLGGFDGSFVKVAPGHFESQTRSGYTGGAMRLRWGDTGAVQLVNVQPPHLSVGCDGIDLGFGSFSFLDPDVFVEKAKAIATAAPAFAFKMALSTLCKECDTIMQELEAALNAINNLSMDACGISQNLGGALGKEIGESIRGGESKDYLEEYRGTFSDPKGAASQWMGRVQGWLGGDIIKAHDATAQGSFISLSLKKYNGFVGNDKVVMARYLRGLFGDVYIWGNSMIKFTQPIGGVPKYIDYLFNKKQADPDSGLRVSTITNEGVLDGKLLAMPVYTQDPIEGVMAKGMIELTKEKITAIKDKVKNNQALDQADIGFLNSLDVPLWKALNIDIYKQKTGAGESVVSDKIVNRVAFEQTKTFIIHISSILQKGMNAAVIGMDDESMTPDAKKYLQLYQEQVEKVNVQILRALASTKPDRESGDDLSEAIGRFEKEFRADAITKFSGRGW